MLKYADYVKNNIQIFLYSFAVTVIFFRNIWWDLIIENFCLELYGELSSIFFLLSKINIFTIGFHKVNKGNNKITELRTILQRESPNS